MHQTSDSPSLSRVLHFFEEISKIPRRSFVTVPIADYLCDFAKARGLFFYMDSADNVIIKKDASRDCEETTPVILQAHTDMVLVKSDPDADIDESHGVSLLRDGDTLRANGTSLGGDDGIGMAYILAILDDDKMTHPPIEAIFTTNEEVGLLGAAALDASALKGRMLINLDSDEEGILTAGCAGGSTATLSIPFSKNTEKKCFSLMLSNLPGGHSGADAHKGIANAVLLLLSLLGKIGEDTPLMLSEIFGGEADNAIPAFASARFSCKASKARIEEITKHFLSAQTENIGNAAYTVEEVGVHACADEEESEKIIRGILSLPSGILAMDANLPDLPETSLNLGKIKTEENRMILGYSLRSSVDTKCRELEKELSEKAKALSGEAKFDGAYPAWEYTKDSHLREACLSVFREQYNKDATVCVIHAGLECGILAKKLSGLDCISFGPNNKSIHTAKEALSLSSAERVYDYLIKVLAALAKKHAPSK